MKNAIAQLSLWLAGLAAGALLNTQTPDTPDELPCYIPVQVTSVHDADTLRATVPIPFLDRVEIREGKFRAADFDAWEVSKARWRLNLTDAEWEQEIRKGQRAAAEFRQLLDGSTFYMSPVRDGDGMYNRRASRWTVVTAQGRQINVADWMEAHGHTRS